MKFIILSLFAYTLVSVPSAYSKELCARYVVIVTEKKVQSNEAFNSAVDLITTPGLSLIHAHDYSDKGFIAIVALTNQIDRDIIMALRKIVGTVISCESKYDKKPRLSGGN